MGSAFNREKCGKKEGTPEQIASNVRIKADVYTALEMFFIGLSGLLLVGLVIFWLLVNDKNINVKPPYTYIYSAVFLALSALSFYCFKNTDNYYIIDAGKRSVLFHFKFFETVKITPYLGFDMISAVGVTGRRIRQKQFAGGYYHYWVYQLVLLEKNGKMIAISDVGVEEEGRGELNRRVRELSSAIGCRAAECPSKRVLRPVQSYDGWEPDFGEHDSLAETLQTILIVIFVMFALGGIIYLFSR